MPSPVAEVPAAPPEEALAWARRRLSLETDCADVWASMQPGVERDFVLLDVRGPASYAARHVPSAISLPHREMTEARLAAAWPRDTLFVVYCAGPHCNGADRAALRMAMLGRRVKVMIGGMTGWADEGLPFSAVERAA